MVFAFCSNNLNSNLAEACNFILQNVLRDLKEAENCPFVQVDGLAWQRTYSNLDSFWARLITEIIFYFAESVLDATKDFVNKKFKTEFQLI